MLGVLQEQSYNTYNASKDWEEKEEILPVLAHEIVFTSQHAYLLGNDKKVYQKSNRKWKELNLPYSVVDLVEGSKGKVFILDEKRGIYPLADLVKTQPAFASQYATNYSKFFKSDKSLIAIAHNKIGENIMIEIPDSIPVLFKESVLLKEKPLKVFSGANVLFTIESKIIYELDRIRGEKLW